AEAVDRIATAIRSTSPERVAVWPGHGAMTNGLGGPLAWRFAHQLGAQWWPPSIVCWGVGGFGAWLTGVVAVNTADDMAAHSDLILLWGSNLASQPTTAPRILAARRRGARVVAIDVRRTEAFQHADQGLVVRPGTDAALALAMLHVITHQGLADEPFARAHTAGYQDLVAHVAPFTPRWAARETGLDAAAIEELARAYAASEAAVILLGGSSMHKSSAGYEAARAITCLPAVTGNLGRPGAGMGPRHGAGTGSNALAGIVPPSKLPPDRVMPGEMSSILEHLEQGDVDVLLLPGTNMRSSFTGGGRLDRALRRTGTVACVDLFMSDTARGYADVVLPGTSWLEETGFKLGPSHIHLMDGALAPRGEAKPVWHLFRELAARLDLSDYFPWAGAEDVVDAMLAGELTRRQTVAALRENGPSARTAAPDFAYASLHFDTPSGKVELRSGAAARLGLPELPAYTPPVQDAYPLQFAQGRTLNHFHGFFDHGRALPTLARADPEPRLWIAPTDAGARGIADGERVRLHNARGEMVAVASVTDRVPAGTVWMRDGWLGINDLTDPGRTVPDAAVHAFSPAGSARFDARIEVARLNP
ncbi:MAG: molybdopterin-dependent oxidoreductase, partial [Candidatus Dormibacteraeota bacterium]|nr:molybdopterin-dependent oxidoreductase [Candidatus Dormibacteraeota bacterium]